MYSIDKRCAVLDSHSTEYPDSLHQLERPPEHLFCRGNRALLKSPCISIVGARRPTPYGLAIAELAAGIAALHGLTVVSGGAMGCDSAAQREALRLGGSIIIVSGCGADRIYPRTSSDLFCAADGDKALVVSLEKWGQEPRRYAFPKRNVIIAALSPCLIVTEGTHRSGTMSTAEAALQLNRALYAIPGSIFSAYSAGTNALIRDGASMICDAASLEVVIALEYGDLVHGQEMPDGSEKKRIHPALYALIASPERPQVLADRLGIHVLDILKMLTDFETQGLIERLADGRYSPTKALLKQSLGASM